MRTETRNITNERTKTKTETSKLMINTTKMTDKPRRLHTWPQKRQHDQENTENRPKTL